MGETKKQYNNFIKNLKAYHLKYSDEQLKSSYYKISNIDTIIYDLKEAIKDACKHGYDKDEQGNYTEEHKALIRLFLELHSFIIDYTRELNQMMGEVQ